MNDLWTSVDEYVCDQLIPANPAIESALEASAAAGLPEIQVSPAMGRLLQLYVRMLQARRVLELGTLGGYSTIWLAGGLPPGGRIISIESETHHAEVARINLARAGYADQVEVRTGEALTLLPELLEENRQPFDLIFIDADKENYAPYLEWALRFSRSGTVIIADNVVRNGAITNPEDADSRVQGVRKFYELLAAEPRVSATVIQTVGCKGYDGFAVGLVN